MKKTPTPEPLNSYLHYLHRNYYIAAAITVVIVFAFYFLRMGWQALDPIGLTLVLIIVVLIVEAVFHWRKKTIIRRNS